jgi:glucosylceramidase
MKSPTELFIKPTAENNYVGQDPWLDAANYELYATYLLKYLQAYKAEGVNIWGLSPQNEPLGNGGNWETMRWDPEGMAKFIGENLGPRLASEKFDTKIMIFDHNKGDVNGDAVRWANYIINDAKAAPYVWGTAIHWYGSTINPFTDALDAIHDLDPKRAILATEATIDGLSDMRPPAAPSPAYQDSWLKDEFYWTKNGYDWGYWWAQGAAHDLHPAYEPLYRYARDIITGLNHWYVGWIDWNVALDSTGGPNHEKNWCAAPVMVDAKTHKVFYSPLFSTMKHFSKYIKPKAKVLESSVKLAKSLDLTGYDGMPTEGLLATASKNPDGTLAIVLFNETAKAADFELQIDGQSARGSIDAQALQTLIWTKK